jgi:hypothetical protein
VIIIENIIDKLKKKSKDWKLLQEPCVRVKENNLGKDEKHPCWFCGEDISLQEFLKYFCEKCQNLICPHCKKCFCNCLQLEKEFLMWIHKNYCIYSVKMFNFSRIKKIPNQFNEINDNLIQNVNKTLKICSNYYKKVKECIICGKLSCSCNTKVLHRTTEEILFEEKNKEKKNND